MLKEKIKLETILRGNRNEKNQKIKTQKVSLCLANYKSKISNQKSNSFRKNIKNLGIKFKTTKSSPEKNIIDYGTSLNSERELKSLATAKNISSSKQKNSIQKSSAKVSQTTPVTNQNSRQQSKDKITRVIPSSKKNSILTNLTRHTEQIKKQISSRERSIPKKNSLNLNLTNLITSTSGSFNTNKTHLTTGNSPNRYHLTFNKFKPKPQHHNDSGIKGFNNSVFKSKGESVIYSLKRSTIKKNGVFSNSKSTSHSVSKRKIVGDCIKKALIPKANSSLSNSKSKAMKTAKKIIDIHKKKPVRSDNISKRGLVSNNTNVIPVNLSNTTLKSMKSALLKDGTYYNYESDKISNYIKEYYRKNHDYPRTRINFYKFGRLIGRGAFGKVNIGLHVLSGRLVAIKSFNKKKPESSSMREKIHHEISLMKTLRHSSIVKIFETLETEKYIMIVMENISGGDLLSYVKKRAKLSEKTAKIIFKQLILAIKYIHSRGIIHRDIKLDNILIDLNNSIKLCDFGVGKQFHKGDILTDQCGTPAYIAPEILRNMGYEGPPVDLWSSGVVLYAMLTGTVPFKGDLNELNNLIQRGKYPVIRGISAEAANLLDGLLETDPKKRLTCDKVLNHPWLCNVEECRTSLFTKAEIILLSKSNVDYRNCKKEEMIENFTLKNLDTKNTDINKNSTTKSVILAPFSSTINSDSEDSNSRNQLKIENNVVLFDEKARHLNRHYELNNNGEIDHSIIINNTNSKTDSIKSLSSDDLVVSSRLSPKENSENFITKKNSQQRNLTSLTNSSTLLIDESVLKIIEGMGYSKDYVQKSLTNNDHNYATATYHLISNE